MRSRSDGGAALIAALWLLVTISVLGLKLSLDGRMHRALALGLVESTVTEAAAQAGTEDALARLWQAVRQPPTRNFQGGRQGAFDPWERPGLLLPDTVALGRARYRVEIRDLGAAMNLNHADQRGLEAFLAAFHVDRDRANRIAEAILDWRDPDQDRRNRGAERADYVHEARPLLPPDTPFSRVGELRFVSGMDPDLYERIHPHLRTLGSPQVNLNTAPPEVLMTLPGVGPRVVATILTRRRRDRLTGVEQILEALPPRLRRTLVEHVDHLRAHTTFEVREVEIRSTGWLPGTPVATEVQSLVSRGEGRIFVSLRRLR